MAAPPPASGQPNAGVQGPPPRKGAYHKHIQAIHKDQYRSIQSKHSQEMVLIESIKSFFKQRFALEKQYFEGLSKICSSQKTAFDCLKKLPIQDQQGGTQQPQLHDNNVFAIWTEMLASIEEKASNYAAHLQGLEGEILKDVKKLKANKQQRNKKFFERVGFLQKEVESSVQELDRTKRIYFSEESEAMDIQKRAQAADDIARGRKKDMKSFFVSKSKLKKTAGNLSVRQDEVEIRSTGARNDYILSLATANAHQHQYFKFALPETVGVLEADIYNKVQGYYSKFIEAEMERVRSSHEIFSVLKEKTSKTSRAANYNLFCVSYPSLMEHVTYIFENCPGDNVDKITTSEHDGGYSLNYEARQNASKLNQAVKTINAFEKRIEACQYHRSKGLTREPNDTGGPDLETKICELDIAISNAKTDKAKAEARLARLREGGVAVDEYIDAFVVERKRQQEAAEAQRARDEAAANAAASAQNEEQEENFEMQEVRADSFDEPAAQSAAAPVEDDGWATWDDAPAANAEPEPVAANDNEDWAAFDQQPEVVQEEAPQAPAEVHDTEGLKQVTVLYNFDAQNGDELTITENEVVYLSNEECDEEGWAVCINAQGQKGYVPCNYLELEEQAAAESADQNEVADGSNHQEPYVEPVRPEPEEVPWETSWPGMQPSEPAQQPSQPPPMPVESKPPWELQSDEEDSSDEDEDEEESGATESFAPPPGAPPPIPDCPPPIYEFSKSHSISIDGSLSTFGDQNYCQGMYDYEATGSDEISFNAGDRIKILNRIPNGVDDGWWKGMVKSGDFAGTVGLFPSIIIEPLDDSDSERTEDSLESPMSSCAPPQMSPPKTPMIPQIPKDSLGPGGPEAVIVTAPTPLTQSPVQVDKDDTSEEEPAKHPLENSSSEEGSPVREEPPPPTPQPPTKHPLENSSSEEEAASPVRDQPPVAPVSIVINEPQPIVEVTIDSPESEPPAPPNIEVKSPSPPQEVAQPPSPPQEETPQVVEPTPKEEIPELVKVKDEPIFSSSESEEAIASPPPPPVQQSVESDEDDSSLPPPPPPAAADSRKLKRVDTADSSSDDDSSEEGPVKALSDSDSSDSSDHVPPEDLQVKQLKKLDTLKESSA